MTIKATLAALGAALGLVALLGGCASVNPVVQSEPAPVAYRVGAGDMNVASLRAPSFRGSGTFSPVVAPAPRTVTRSAERPPAPVTVETLPPQPLPRIPAPSLPVAPFDADAVDRDLYAHQRIGKRYTIMGKSYKPRHQPKYDVTGTASWYGPKFHGNPTASGEIFDMNALSAAHKTLPLHSLVHVENLETGASLILRVNDRGPFIGDRIIDLSKGAAMQLGLLESGLKEVRVRYAGPADPNSIGRSVWQPEPAPAAVAEAAPAVPPVSMPPVSVPPIGGPESSYVPLRDLLEDVAEAVPALPQVLPRIGAPVAAPALPYAYPDAPDMPVAEPQADDGRETLTIKGPIHLARSRNLPHAERVLAAKATR